MQMNISIRHGHVSEATQAMIREKLDKLTRLYDRISAIEAHGRYGASRPADGRPEGICQEARFRGGRAGRESAGRGRHGGRQNGTATAETQGEGSRSSSRRRAPRRMTRGRLVTTPPTPAIAVEKGEYTHEVCRLYLSRRHPCPVERHRQGRRHSRNGPGAVQGGQGRERRSPRASSRRF